MATIHLDPPKLNGKPEEQLAQLQRLLTDYSEQINYFVNNIEVGNFTPESQQIILKGGKTNE